MVIYVDTGQGIMMGIDDASIGSKGKGKTAPLRPL